MTTPPLNTVTLALGADGEQSELVPFQAFATAIAKFYELIHALTDNVPGQTVDWVVESLEISSAIATVKGLGERDHVERVVRAYVEVGTAIQEHRAIPYPPNIAKAARGLTSILNHRVRTIRFETAEREAIVRSQDLKGNFSLEENLDIAVTASI